MAADIGLKLTAGGEKAFQAALKSVSAQIDALTANMDDAVVKMDAMDDAEQGQTIKAQRAAKAQDLYRQKLRLLSDQEERQRAKLTELKTALDQTAQAQGEDSAAAEKARAAYANQESALAKTAKAIAQAKTGLGRLTREETAAGKAADGAGDQLEEMGEKEEEAGGKTDSLADKISSMAKIMQTRFVLDVAKTVAQGLQGIANKLGSCVSGAYNLAAAAAEMADGVQSEAKRLKIGDELYQELDYAAKQVGVDTETIVTAMKNLDKNVQKPNSRTKRAFKQLGVSLKDAEGNAKSSEQVFSETVDALAQIENPAKRDRIAMQLFGVKASELSGLLDAGGEAFQGYRDEANELGAVMSGDNITTLANFKNKIDAVKTAAEGVKNAIGAQLTPVFSPFAETAKQALSDFTAAVNDGFSAESMQTLVTNFVTNLETGLTNFGDTLTTHLPTLTTAFTTLVNGLNEALPGLMETVGPVLETALTTAFTALSALTDPLITAATTIVANLATYIGDHAGDVMDKATDILMKLVDGITNALPQLIPAAIQIMAKLGVGIVNAVPQILSRIPNILTNIKDGFMATDWGQVGRDIIDAVGAAFASIGQTIIGWFTGGKAEVEGSAEATDWSGVGNLISSSVSGVLSGVGGFLSAGFEAAKALIEGTPWADVATGIQSAVSGTLEGIGGFLEKGFSAAKEAIGKIDWGSLGGTISGALSGAVDVLKSIGGSIWETITGWFGGDNKDDSEESAKDIMDGVADGFADTSAAEQAASGAGQKIRGALEAQLTYAFGLLTGQGYGLGIADGVFQGGDWGKTGGDIDEGISGGMKNKKGEPEKSAKTVADAIHRKLKNEIGSGGSRFKGLGKDVCAGLAAGIKDARNLVEGAIKEVVDKAIEKIKRELGIQSPSRVFRYEIGQMIGKGMALGIRDGVADVREAVGTLSEAAAGSAFGAPHPAFAGAGGGFNFTQNVYANRTSYAAQQREAKRQFMDALRRL